MTRASAGGGALVVALLACLGACTLLLPTEKLIDPCVADEDCAEGFECLENACLPFDDAAGGTSG
jgi:hypothetical protein